MGMIRSNHCRCRLVEVSRYAVEQNESAVNEAEVDREWKCMYTSTDHVK